jgi:tetratricopeptide (TPR) repeat protein
MIKNNNEVTDNLFALVKSLTASEKRQFTVYAGRVAVNNESKFISLFKVLCTQTKYDEAAILNSTDITKQQLSNIKSHLYTQILTSLRLNPAVRSVPLQIREQLDFAMILYRKGLYQQSLKVLDKIKSMALLYEEKITGYEIVDLEKIIESQYITRSRANRADLLIEQANELSHLNSVANVLSNLTLYLYNLFLKNGYVRTPEEKEEVSAHFLANLPQYDEQRFGFREKLWHCQAYVWYSFIIQDFVSCYKYATKWVALFDKAPHLIAVHPVFYIKGNHYVLESLFYLNRSKQFEAALDNFEAILGSTDIPEDDNIMVLSFLYVYSNKLNLRFMKAEYTNGDELLETINKKIERYRDKVDDHHIMILYYKMACLYFGDRKYDKCIYFLKKIIDSKATQLREDLVCFTMILNLAAHYEAGQDYRLEALIKSTRVFLSKMNHLHEVQKALMEFLGSLPQISPLTLKDEFRKFHAVLSQFENHPFERRAFLYLDLLSWLESHINDEPIAQVIARKIVAKQKE